ncbi:MAG: peptidylprolyl isomerase [Proteobacteria bacterium]|nr:peptidylprolyl isomerase [Pseudomonadota bacterium]MBU1687464.1 peptidylprolyl isomerase [Pseudomonadota bacterium]
MSKVVKKGSRVTVTYTGKFEDGTVFESNVGRTPLEFNVGKGKVIKGFEKGVLGMTFGQTKTVTMKPADAYGQKDPELIVTVPAGYFPQAIDPEVGREVDFTIPAGDMIQGVITAIDSEDITVDGNHPLAGKTLIFEIKLIGLK